MRRYRFIDMQKSSYGVLLLFCILLITGNVFSQDTRMTVKEADTARLNDTVEIAYGKQPAWKVTASIASATGADLRKTTAPTFTNTLYGRIPGLTVMQVSGEPGYDAPLLYARGQSSYKGGNILTFVDGFEMPFDQLVPEEVETVSLLKDASALALYGMRAANGVLLITTKKGKKGSTEVNFSAQTGLQQATRLQNSLGSFDYATLYNEALKNEGKPARYTQADLDAYRLGNDPYFHPNVNWNDELLKKSAPMSNYDLNFRGGSDDVKYFVLLNVLQNSGLYDHTDPDRKESSNANFLRYNFRSNVDVNITKTLTASLYLSGRVEDRTTPNGTNSTEIFDRLILTPPNAFPVYTPKGTYGGSSIYVNPLASVIGGGLYNSHTRTFQTAFQLSQKLDMFIPGLSADATLAFSNYFAGTTTKSKSFAMYSLSKNDAGETVYTTIGQDKPISASEGYRDQWRRSNVQLRLNYDHSFGESDLNLMGMFLQDQYTLAGDNVPFAYQNFAGRATYAYKKKYVGEFSASYSGTDNFAKGSRFGFFPAVSAGWILSEEDFLKNNELINFLKVRASYGQVGNDQIGGQRYSYNQYYFMQGGYNLGDANTFSGGMDEGSIANPGVTWEKKNITNIGFDAIFFRNLNVSFDVFNEVRYDILAEPESTVPDILGITLPALNDGKVKNKGFEVSLKYSGKIGKDFQYFTEMSAWYAKNKIVNMSEPIQPYAYLYKTGQAIDQPFGLVSDGFYQVSDFEPSGKLKAGLPVPQFGPVQPGDIKYKNQNSDNVIDVYDYKAIGKTNVPNWVFGFRTGFKYHNFNLDAFFQGVTDRTVYLNGTNVWAFQNNAGVTAIALNRWTPETAASATYPRLSTTTNENNYRISDFWQRNGSFVKLRSIELGYDLPKSLIRKIKLNNALIYINGTNLFTIDKVDIADPEVLSGYPSLRAFNLGIKVGL